MGMSNTTKRVKEIRRKTGLGPITTYSRIIGDFTALPLTKFHP